MKMKVALLVGMMALSSIAFGKSIRVKVNGMVCAFCAQGITKKFKAQPQVETVDVKLEDKTVTLTVKEKQDLTDEKIKEILTDSGYSVDAITRE